MVCKGIRGLVTTDMDIDETAKQGTISLTKRGSGDLYAGGQEDPAHWAGPPRELGLYTVSSGAKSDRSAKAHRVYREGGR